jgi:hypothetical protein
MAVLDYGNNIRASQELREIASFNREYVDQMLDYWEENLPNIFRRQKDILVADAVLEMFRRRENVENFNNTNLMSEFRNTGQIDTANTGSFL